MTGLSPSEAELTRLVTRTGEGDSRALERLCSLCYPEIRQFFLELLPEEADDLTQELFADLRRKLDGYEESGRFMAWLRSVAFNLFRTRNRSVRRRREATLTTGFDLELAETTLSLFTTRKQLLRAAAKQLPASLREAWGLYAEGYEPRAIGGRLDISPGAAATRVSRAKDLLTRILGRAP